MFQIDQKSRKSIYEQVIDNIKELIIRGILKPNEKLPSVRDLSRQLVINPNTTAKAYKELEAMGFIYTETGIGTFVKARKAKAANDEAVENSLKKIASGVEELKYMGMSDSDISEAIHKMLEERRDKID